MCWASALLADDRELIQCGDPYVKPAIRSGCEERRHGEGTPNTGSTEFLDLYFTLDERGNLLDRGMTRVHAE